MTWTHRWWNYILIEDWKRKARGHKVFITPHHMGYQTGYRGYNWNFFTEADQTPFVEMYSRHGLAESDQEYYSYLHDMGPRQWEGTIQCGLEQGKKFGIMGSTTNMQVIRAVTVTVA